MVQILATTKSYLAVIIAVGLFLIPVESVAAGDDDVHAYGLAFEFSQSVPPLASCNPETGLVGGWGWIVRVIFLGRGVGTSGVDSGDVTAIVCNGDTPQQIRERLTARIQELAAAHGYVVKSVNIVVPMLQRGE